MRNIFSKIENSFFGLPKKIKSSLEKYINQFQVAKKKLQNFTQTNFNLGIYHIDRCNMSDAKLRFYMVTKLDPSFAAAHYHLARCHLYNLDFESAKAELETAILLDKNNESAVYRLKMLNHEIVNEQIPIQVIEEDYDNLAKKYNEVIENQEQYNIQEILAEMLKKQIKLIEEPFVLDLGCGSGLMGGYLKHIVSIKSQIGVDISSRMIDIAKELVLDDQHVYNDIRKLDFHNLSSLSEKYDVITACMSLVYVNDLAKMFKKMNKVVSKRAVLGLVVLKSAKNDISFDYKNACYSFSQKYLENVFKESDWIIAEHKELKSFLNGSNGLVYTLKKRVV